VDDEDATTSKDCKIQSDCLQNQSDNNEIHISNGTVVLLIYCKIL